MAKTMSDREFWKQINMMFYWDMILEDCVTGKYRWAKMAHDEVSGMRKYMIMIDAPEADIEKMSILMGTLFSLDLGNIIPSKQHCFSSGIDTVV